MARCIANDLGQGLDEKIEANPTEKKTMNEYRVTYTNGARPEDFETYDEAHAAILARWPDAEIGHDGDLESFGDCTLFWSDEATSIDDDGARALGSILRIA